MSIAVVDTGGNLVSLERMDNAILASLDIAIGKAYTAVAMKMSTADLAPVVQPGQPLYNLEIANQPRTLVAFGGGIPLQANGEVVGGVGVSGGTADQDQEVAEATQGWSKRRSRSTAPSVRFFRFEAAPAKASGPFSEAAYE